MKRYQILRQYNICGQMMECLCDDIGMPIVYGEDVAQERVAQLHNMGHTSARYEELPCGNAWFDDENWIG